MIVKPTADWSAPMTLAAETIFQVHAGSVLLDLGGAAATLNDGLMLVQDPDRPLRDSVVVPSGVTLRHRNAGLRPATLYIGSLG